MTNHTGLGMNLRRFLPSKFKMNSKKCLLFRAYNVCSSYLSLHNELTFLTSYFIKNCFSNNTLSNQIKKFLHKQYIRIPKLPNVIKEILYFKFPYCLTGDHID